MKYALLILVLQVTSEVSAQTIAFTPSFVGGIRAADVALEIALPTTTTSVEALRTWTIPADTFPSLIYAGFESTCLTRGENNTNNKNARLYFGGIAGTQILAEASTTANQTFLQSVRCWVDSGTTFMCYTQRCIGASCAQSSATYTFTPSASLAITCAGYTNPAGDVTLTGQASYWLMK